MMIKRDKGETPDEVWKLSRRWKYLVTPFGYATPHRTQRVRVGRRCTRLRGYGLRHAQIDRKLAPLVRLLWERGIETISCCQGIGLLPAAIVFYSLRDAQKFARLVKGAKRCRIRVGDGGPYRALDGKTYRAWVANIPTADIAAVARHVRAHRA